MPLRFGKTWDAFICHARREQKGLRGEFARRLQASGLSVWYDVFSLKVVNSLRRKIDEGLAKFALWHRRTGKHFFAKNGRKTN